MVSVGATLSWRRTICWPASLIVSCAPPRMALIRRSLSSVASPGADERAQGAGVVVGKADGNLDPLPAFIGDLVGHDLQLLGGQPVEEARILQPAAIVGLEQVAQDDAAGRLIGVDPDEHGALVGGAHRRFRQHATDLIGLLRPAVAERVPDLFLAGMVGGDGESHQLLERHAVVGIGFEQRRRYRREPQPLLDDVDGHEEGGRDLLLGLALLAKGLEGAKLVERMERGALAVFGERIVLGEDAGRGIAHHAGHGRGLSEALLLDQPFERPVAPAAGRDLEHASFLAFGVEHGADIEALKQAAPGDVLGQFLDRDAGLHTPDVRLAQHQLVEGDVARGRQGDLLNGSSHGDFLRDGRPKASLPASNPSRKSPQPSSSRGGESEDRGGGEARVGGRRAADAGDPVSPRNGDGTSRRPGHRPAVLRLPATPVRATSAPGRASPARGCDGSDNRATRSASASARSDDVDAIRAVPLRRTP
jgi:hypothetical protein